MRQFPVKRHARRRWRYGGGPEDQTTRPKAGAVLIVFRRAESGHSRRTCLPAAHSPECGGERPFNAEYFLPYPESQIFINCRVPPRKPIWRQSGSILVRNSKARPAVSVNDLGAVPFQALLPEEAVAFRLTAANKVGPPQDRKRQDRPRGKAADLCANAKRMAISPFPSKLVRPCRRQRTCLPLRSTPLPKATDTLVRATIVPSANDNPGWGDAGRTAM